MAFTPEIALEYLTRAQAGGRLGHAYMITGGDKPSRARFVLDAVRSLTGNPANSLESAVGEFVHLIRPESVSRVIKIKQIRPVERKLVMASGGTLKIAIIEGADRLNESAANAFLKTLEEPPADCLIFLVTGNPEQLLDTILSRCIRLSLRDVPIAQRIGTDEREILSALRNQFVEPGFNGKNAIGLLGYLNALLKSVKDQFKAEFDSLQKEEAKSLREVTDARDFLKDREDYYKAATSAAYLERRHDLLTTLMAWFGDCLRQSTGQVEDLAFTEEVETTSRVASILGPDEILRRIAAVEDLFRHLGTNVSEPLALEVGILEAFN